MQEFREHLVGWTLRTISDLFMSHGFTAADVPEEQLPSGQRRSLVEQYYAGIQLRDPAHLNRLLNVFEDIIFELPQEGTEHERRERSRLLGLLKRDGFEFINERLVATEKEPLGLNGIASAAIDTEHLHLYLDRITGSIEKDPGLAIGSAKELVEATLKTILRANGAKFDEADDLPGLLRLTQKELELVPRDIPESAKGADTIRRVLSNLGSIVYGIAELRNLYGSGHGRSGRLKGLQPRHARLAVTSAGALCSFLIETFEARTKATKEPGSG